MEHVVFVVVFFRFAVGWERSDAMRSFDISPVPGHTHRDDNAKN